MANRDDKKKLESQLAKVQKKLYDMRKEYSYILLASVNTVPYPHWDAEKKALYEKAQAKYEKNPKILARLKNGMRKSEAKELEIVQALRAMEPKVREDDGMRIEID
jgi:hypothetical protein